MSKEQLEASAIRLRGRIRQKKAARARRGQPPKPHEHNGKLLEILRREGTLSDLHYHKVALAAAWRMD